MIHIEDMRLEVPGFTLGPINLEIDEGQYFVLCGPSGSGKTSLVEWTAGFRPAQSGRLLVGGTDVTAMRPAERKLALVFQDSALFPHLSVRDNIGFSLRMAKHSPDQIRRRVDELTELLRIGHRLDALPNRISGGEARRAALARALALPKPVLLLDEPLSSVDPALHRDLRRELAQLHRHLGLTVIHITHSIAEARSLATEIGVLVSGALEQTGPTADVFERPDNAVVARALTVPNFVEGRIGPDGQSLELEQGSIPIASGRGEGKRARLFDLKLAETAGALTRDAELLGTEIDERGRPSAWVRLRESGIELEIELDETLPARDARSVHIDFSESRAEFY
ncbi:MAG: ABC transporter ATP-binding protein [Polyangiaceae bacterium]|nr:ABC transporter ATP-binding protein [Polyangiaceae bacterium]